jgi:transcription antitermination factor NusG
MECINNETLKEIKEKLTEKEPEIKVDPIKPCEKFKEGVKVIAMKGIHIGKVYTIEKIDLLHYEAKLKHYELSEEDYIEIIHVYLDDLENEFEPLEDEE